jgi:redox-sensitive bicupin YhaK (pirin superfamily)
MNIQVYPPEQQGVGAFDNGKFIEQRPIGFPGDSSSVDRVGPLFYWAWGKAEHEAEIGMHPHKAFEILTYVIQGRVEHQDSLGTKQTVTTGGAQIMQTGSGVYHGEAFRGGNVEGFQIWFEPHLSQAVKKQPTYNQYDHEQFPSAEKDGAIFKTVIGEGSPIHIDTDVLMHDLILEPGVTYSYPLAKDRLLSFLVLRGAGKTHDDTTLNHKDFVLVSSEADKLLTIQAGEEHGIRIVTIEVPAAVDYPLYRK